MTRLVKKFLIDITDARFFIPANDDVIAFIRRVNPFAHSDVGSVLFALAKQVPGAHAYCPAAGSCAYVVLHSASNRIFAIAWDQRGIAFRVGASSLREAIADGGEETPAIGLDWARFDPWAGRSADGANPQLVQWGGRALEAIPSVVN